MSHCSGVAVSRSDTAEGKRPRLAAEVRLTRHIPQVRAISDRPHPRDGTDSATRSQGEEDNANEMFPCYARVSQLKLKFPDIKKNTSNKNSPSFNILPNFFLIKMM